MEKTPMRTTDPSFQAGPQKVKWIDGLRGVASFLVILTHLSRAFDPALFSTRDDETAPIRFLQLPFFRIPPQGRIGVVIFSFVTGYVCTLKPIRQMREGNQIGALSTVAKSAFRRFPRLFIPTAVVTVIAWLLAQLGAFEIAKHSGSVWLDWSSPDRKDFVDSIVSLWWNLINTWISGKNEYDDHQWTLLQLVKGAFLVYVALSAVAFMQTRYRMMTAALMTVYYYCCGEPNFGMQFFFGMLLCDISQDTEIQSYIAKRRWMTTILPSILIPFGLYICSYPSERAEWASWSRPFLTVRQIIIPKNLPYGDGSIAWMYTGIGVDFIAVGLQLSPLARDVLSNRFFLWLGRNSFAVYLTHGTMLRVVLVRMLYGNSIPQNTEAHNENGDIVPPEPLHIVSVPWRFILVPIWFVCVYYVAFLWTNYVDSWAARVTKALETHVFVEEEGQGSGERARDLRLP